MYSCILDISFITLRAPATPAVYTLSLHDALPISAGSAHTSRHPPTAATPVHPHGVHATGAASIPHTPTVTAATGSQDRKSTRLNSSHVAISYAVFCLKKKKTCTN